MLVVFLYKDFLQIMCIKDYFIPPFIFICFYSRLWWCDCVCDIAQISLETEIDERLRVFEIRTRAVGLGFCLLSCTGLSDHRVTWPPFFLTLVVNRGFSKGVPLLELPSPSRLCCILTIKYSLSSPLAFTGLPRKLLSYPYYTMTVIKKVLLKWQFTIPSYTCLSL